MDYQTLINLGLAMLALSTAAGLGLQRGRVIRLREDLRDERESNESLRKQRTDDRREIDQLTSDLSALSRVVTGEAHWVAIGQLLDEHHAHATEHWQAERELLAKIRDNTTPQRTP